MAKILIIEDEDLLLEPLCEMLRGENFEVFSAYTGEAGLELAVAEQPDVILCDIVLPGMNGYAVLTKLCEDPRTQEIPVVFITGQKTPPEIQAGYDLGVDVYLWKPASRLQILTAINKQLAKRQAGKNGQ